MTLNLDEVPGQGTCKGVRWHLTVGSLVSVKGEPIEVVPIEVASIEVASIDFPAINLALIELVSTKGDVRDRLG